MIFDAVAAEPDLLRDVDRLTSAGGVELLAPLETVREVAAVPDRGRRRALQRVRVLVVPPADRRDPEVRRALGRLEQAPGISGRDARIALAAAVRGVPLATEDRNLRRAVADQLPQVAVWGWASDLRPRILAVARECPA